MTEDEIMAIEQGWRGMGSHRAQDCDMCTRGWPLINVENLEWGQLHNHLVPWDYDYGNEPDWPDPRQDIKKLIDALREAQTSYQDLQHSEFGY